MSNGTVVQIEGTTRELAQANSMVASGAAMVAAGVGLTGFTLMLKPGGIAVLFFGLVICGIGRMVRGAHLRNGSRAVAAGQPARPASDPLDPTTGFNPKVVLGLVLGIPAGIVVLILILTLFGF